MIEQVLLADGEICRFCSSTAGRRIMIESEFGFAAWDLHPASVGHFLVIPHRHVSDYFKINDQERQELWRLVSEGKAMVDVKHNPDGYNIGINVGKWSGQSIPHLHIHVIPRYQGDVENPKGGVRGVIPQKKLYTNKLD
jgi:diadenosine tetraphosphate (Ap4A) HIT family hydrolase|tara:strand:+ start:632 stop:1048 length:417 start_codon:yes stop_codon:yes gene_type:complete